MRKLGGNTLRIALVEKEKFNENTETKVKYRFVSTRKAITNRCPTRTCNGSSVFIKRMIG